MWGKIERVLIRVFVTAVVGLFLLATCLPKPDPVVKACGEPPDTGMTGVLTSWEQCAYEEALRLCEVPPRPGSGAVVTEEDRTEWRNLVDHNRECIEKQGYMSLTDPGPDMDLDPQEGYEREWPR